MRARFRAYWTITQHRIGQILFVFMILATYFSKQIWYHVCLFMTINNGMIDRLTKISVRRELL